MTERLYYHDSFQQRFDARVIGLEQGGRRVYLDRTAFYPSSGGQPNDLGTLNGIRVVDVLDEGERIAHVLADPLEGDSVTGEINWPRRLDHMEQHTGQHLLSAAFEKVCNAATVSFHLGSDSSTIDLATASISPEQIRKVEQCANENIWANLPVAVSYEEAAQAEGLRKASNREGVLRIVRIGDLDRSACGGTHLSSTSGIGMVSIRKLDKVRGNVRVEFLCGHRALTRARKDFETLNDAARVFGATIDELPSLAKSQQERLQAEEKLRRRIAGELASLEGRILYEATLPLPNGLHLAFDNVECIGDETRLKAQSFIATGRAGFLAIAERDLCFLLAVSEGSGLNAGEMVKTLLREQGGRGGGNARLAQGSVPTGEALDRLVAEIGAALKSDTGA